jgi:hypothetical protein
MEFSIEFSREFHGKFHEKSNVFWNFMENSMEFRGNPRNPIEFQEIFHLIPWNFPLNSMEFHETEVDGIPWNFMNSQNLMEFSFDRAYNAAKA